MCMSRCSVIPTTLSFHDKLVLLIACALETVALLGVLSWLYASPTSGYWPGYADMMGDRPSPLTWLRWVIGDISEVAF